jgi:hypothetical protein
MLDVFAELDVASVASGLPDRLVRGSLMVAFGSV